MSDGSPKGFEKLGPHEVVITKAQPDDTEPIANILYVTWRDTYPNSTYGIPQEDVNQFTEGWLEPDRIQRGRKLFEPNPGVEALVAKTSGAAVGLFYAGPAEDDYGRDDPNEIRWLYVLPEYQGRGIGRQLLEQGLAGLGDDKDVILEVARYNKPAIELYKKPGFFIDRELERDIMKLPSGKIIPEFLMVRKAKQP